jgi:inorganic pyrophosphatase
MHPWHDVELGEKVPDELPAVIEIPRGARAKYEVDKKTGLLRLKRPLVSVAHYPLNYGFFPRTLSTDGDPLDVLVLSQECVPSLTIVDVRPIGGIELKSDEKGTELKLIAVETSDPEYEEIKSLKDLPSYRMDELKQFFETYQKIENHRIEVKRIFGRGKAQKTIKESMARYRENPIAA